MTERVAIGDILGGDCTGQSVEVRGWVYRTRSSGGIAFLLLRDATGVVQSTFRKEEVGEALFGSIEETGREASVVVQGEVAEDARAPGGYEVRGSAFEVVGPSPNFPIARDLSEEFLLDVRHLWIRSRRMTSIFKVRSTVFRAIHDYFREAGFYEVQPPIITPVGSEGGSTLFQVRYFDHDLHLTQSWQLYAEALVMALERIYTVAPSFRAEKSRTPRHLTEYWHAEMEVAWEGMEGALTHGEGVIARVAQEVASRNQPELAYLERDVEYLRGVQPPFPRITYDEALERLQGQGVDVEWGKDLRTLEERALGELFELPVIVTHYPKETQAFYKRTDPSDPDLVLAFDFIAPGRGGELIGGSEREPDLETLKANLVRTGEDPKAYDWYLDTRRYGS
ncbi:MAG: amino acid--tRNA ligase-related protein, partial [Thermoplasmata archaeon]|nr:amino acid--tRNA ligase-related protein [Thermoplasmata archaeon]